MMTGHVQGSGAVAPEVKAVPETVTAALDEFIEAFEAFKDVNDRRLGEIEQKLTADVVTRDKVDRINRAMDDQKRVLDQLALMKSGALDGLSIGFRTVRARTDAKTGVRRILEADLWEISVVTFPMLPSARVSDVKHQRFFRDRETELVRQMRRAAKMMWRSSFRQNKA